MIRRPNFLTFHRHYQRLTFSSFYNFTYNNQESPSLYSHRAKQFIDSDHVINEKVDQLAHLINISKYPIFFTGAGISTSLGIPDYRSGQDTILKTGPGLWNRSDQEMKKMPKNRQSFIDLLIPSITHMAIYTLLKQNVFKHLVSQNTDGLHLRSGVKKSQLSQLHGNRNLEFCIKCQRKYLRDFRTIRRTQKFFKPGEKRKHETGRMCENCGGQLHDSIIYFGQKLPRQELVKGYEQGARSDLCLTLGSSLTVRPSSNIPLLPLQYNKQGKLVIINIQQTNLDNNATLKINGFCDYVMQKLMDKLGIKIEPFKTLRYLQISVQKQYDGWMINVGGIDEKHENYCFIKNVTILNKNLQNIVLQNQQKKKMSQKDIRNQQHFQQLQYLQSKFQLSLDSHHYESFVDMNLEVNFFDPFPSLILNMYELFKENDIIGREVINLKILSRDNRNWEVESVKRQ